MNPNDQPEDDLRFITAEDDELITPIDQRSDANDDPDNLEEADDEDEDDEDDPVGTL